MTGKLTPAVRRWVYGIALAAMPLAVLYGIVSEAAAPLWVTLAGAVLVPGLAIANTPKSNDAER